jgi:hypothetical protein
MITPRSFFTAIACAVAFVGMVALAQAQDATKPNPTGTWMWTTPGRNGGPDRTNTVTLKYADGKLTGSLKLAARGRGAANPVEIANGKLSGNTISFVTTRTAGENTFTNTFKGTLTADTITGKMTVTGGTTERPPVDWVAKRQKPTM